MSAMSRPSGTSILLSATRRGRSSRPPYGASSCSITSRSSTGLRPGSMRGGVDDVHERRAALDVAQEVVAEAAALAGALDQAGHVGDGERRVAGGDHAEVGHQRGERVVGDLGPGPRDRGDQAGLAGAREADQADVGDDLELEDDLELVAGLAEQREAGGLALGARPAPRCRGRRGRPAATTSSVPAPTRSARTLPARVGDDGAVGDRQHQVGAVGAVAVGAGAVAAVLGLARAGCGGSRSAW